MNLEPGSRLGPYEITARAGAGGMGEVWRGRDTRLGRDVAIKVLPAEFAENAQLRARLDREARSISALSHPHICTLFDVGEGFLVMEFIEGESLAARLSRGPLSLTEVLRYGSRSLPHSTLHIARDSCIATSSRATSCSRSRERSCSTSVLPAP